MKVSFLAKVVAAMVVTWGQTSVAAASAVPLPALSEAANGLKNPATPGTAVTAGTRVSLEGDAYSFVPPRGWEHGNAPMRSGLLFQMPKTKGQYQKTIQVQAFKGGISWDEYSFKNFQQYIVNRFGGKSDLIAHYTILNYKPFALDNGQDAIAYYATFLYGDMKMIQLHVLVSTGSQHFLTTFTDLASNFSADSVPPELEPVYASIRSIQVEGDARSSVEKILWAVAGVVGLFVGFFLVRSLSQWLKYRRLQQIARDYNSGASRIADDAEDLKSSLHDLEAEPVYSEVMAHHQEAQEGKTATEQDDVSALDFPHSDHRQAS